MCFFKYYDEAKLLARETFLYIPRNDTKMCISMHRWLKFILVIAILCNSSILSSGDDSCSIIKLGACNQKIPDIIGSSTKQEPKVVGSSAKQETNVVGSSAKQEPNVIGFSAKQEPNVIGSSAKQEPNVIGSSAKQEPNVVGSSAKQEPKVVGSSAKQEPKVVGSSTKQGSAANGLEIKDIQSGIESLQEKQLHEPHELLLPEKNIFIKKLIAFSPILKGQEDLLSVDLYQSYDMLPIAKEILKSIYWTDSAREFKYYWDSYLLGDEIWEKKKNNYYNQSKFIFSNDYKDLINLLGEGFITKLENPCCGRVAAYTEWLLERHGIKANIIVAENFLGKDYGHAWVEVPTQTGEKLYIDLSRSPEYMRTEEEYNPKNSKLEIKRNYHSFEDIYSVINYYGDGSIPRFSWWSTDWGKKIIERTEMT